MNKQKENNTPDWQWCEVVTLVKQLALELKPQLTTVQWHTVELMLRSLLQDSQEALMQYYAKANVEESADATEILFTPVQEQLNLLEDYLEICLL